MENGSKIEIANQNNALYLVLSPQNKIQLLLIQNNISMLLFNFSICILKKPMELLKDWT